MFMRGLTRLAISNCLRRSRDDVPFLGQHLNRRLRSTATGNRFWNRSFIVSLRDCGWAFEETPESRFTEPRSPGSFYLHERDAGGRSQKIGDCTPPYRPETVTGSPVKPRLENEIGEEKLGKGSGR
jgi:hypothetical protein